MELSGRAALVVIDVQVGFESPAWGPRNNPIAEQNMARLIAFWRQTKRKIFHIRHDSADPASPLRPRQWGNNFKPLVAPLPGEPVVPKSAHAAFVGTTLEADLRRGNHGELVLVGLTTNHCVSTTARLAADLGFRTYVAADATAAFARRALDGRMRPAQEVHLAALSDLHGEFATVVETGLLLDAA